LPARRAELDDAVRTQTVLAATVDDARAALAHARAQRDAADDVRARADAKDAADRRKLTLQEQATVAAAMADALLRRRIDERAGELASALRDGQPCPVCGSAEHPHPAPPSDRPVTDDELAAAEQERDAAQQRARQAGEAAATALAAHADAIARAGGLDATDATRAHDAAVARLAAAEAAVRERDRLQVARDRLDGEDARIAGEVVAVREQLADAQRDVTTLDERASATQAAVARARGSFDTVASRIDDGERRRKTAVRLRDALAAARAAADAAEAAADDLDRRVAASDFADAATARAALRSDDEQVRLDERVRGYDKEIDAQRVRLVDLEMQLAGIDEPLPEVAASATALADAREAAEAAADAAAAAAHAVDALAELAGRALEGHARIAELEARQRLIAGVADAVAGRNERKMDLETFVLAAELEQIVAAANLRLDAMSQGRYRLAHTDALAARNAASGLGLEVVDAYTGQARPAQSLSGGETFLASLALALGLAQVVTDRAGGIRLDTLFIDEGFGSLDPETLDLAMRTLDELREGGRTVGVISHVEAMKEQITAQLAVEAAAHGPSAVRQSALDPV
jgi:exonuclease SbcC